MSTIRYHEKSRKGCLGCKTGRVKCDEGKPKCGRCRRRGDICTYPQPNKKDVSNDLPLSDSQQTGDSRAAVSSHPERTPQSLLQLDSFGSTHYGAKQILDLRLMHHYTLSTFQSFARDLPSSISDSLRVDIPLLAFQHDFLLDTVLFVSMVHLGCTEPQTLIQLPVYLYKDQALRALRHTIASPTPDSERAIKGASILLATVSFAADRITQQPGLWTTNWLTLVTGQRNFRSHMSETSTPGKSPEAPPPRLPADIQEALWHHIHGESPDDIQILLHTAYTLGGVISELASSEQAWTAQRVKSLFFNMEMSKELLVMVRGESPKALVVLAYCVTLIGLLPRIWLYEGVAAHDVAAIAEMIGSEWEKYLALPKLALQIEDPTEVIRLMNDSLVWENQE